jgi:acetyl esterase
MADVNLRLRAFGWLTRRLSPIATMTDAQVVATQGRQVPANPVSRWIFGMAPPSVTLADRLVPGPAGDVAVRLYTAPGDTGRDVAERPLVLYFHGGGFVVGDLSLGDWICGTVAAATGAVVVSVAYRLAPVHRFPAAVEDCYAALSWASGHAAELGAAGLLGVMGESAGGNLAAVMPLVARERGGPVISHQSLIYPATDLTDAGGGKAAASPSTPFLSGPEMSAYNRLYLGPDGDRAHPWASPLLAADHSALPPALVQVAEHDPLRGDGRRYAEVLRAAGIPVRLTEYAGQPHGFVNFPGLSPAAYQALAEVCAEQAAALVRARRLG